MDRDIEQALTSNVKPDPAIAAVIAAVIAEFQRLLRRRVLSLPWAAGVRVTRACCFYFHRDSDVERAAALRRAAHFLSPEVSCRYQVRDDPTDPRRAIWSVLQTPTAPELIWPEPEAKADNERRYRRVSSQLYEQPPAYE